jgi:hypothetical protein
MERPICSRFSLVFFGCGEHTFVLSYAKTPACLHVCVKGTKRFAPPGSLHVVCVCVQCAFDAATEAKFNLRARRPGFKSNKNANWPRLCAVVLFWF